MKLYVISEHNINIDKGICIKNDKCDKHLVNYTTPRTFLLKIEKNATKLN